MNIISIYKKNLFQQKKLRKNTANQTKPKQTKTTTTTRKSSGKTALNASWEQRFLSTVVYSMYEDVRAADIHVVGFFTSPREKQANYANAKPRRKETTANRV